MFVKPLPQRYKIAAIMLECEIDDLPIKLKEKLDDVQGLINKVKSYGQLHSSQVIATVVQSYLEEQHRHAIY